MEKTFSDNVEFTELNNIAEKVFKEDLYTGKTTKVMRFIPNGFTEGKDLYEKEIKQIETFFSRYANLYQCEWLSISNCYADECNQNVLSFCVHVGTGQNGSTQFSTQSLNYIMDITRYMEVHFGARCFIASTGYANDMLSYILHIIIWKYSLEKKETGNLRRLYFDESAWEKHSIGTWLNRTKKDENN